jgi:hypothetical protein
MGWEPARLIPVGGIANDQEAETRATSALLAVLTTVRPLSKQLLGPLGASKASTAMVEAFTETPFKTRSGASVRPDGLLRVTFGRQDPWVALVEVKTGTAKLRAEQIDAYLDVARSEGFDCVITISNEIESAPGVHPTEGVKHRSNSRVALHHFSWSKILSAAVTIKVHHGVDDPEQAWILGELIRYLEHPKSGALEFDDMGDNWVTVRDGAREGTLKRRDDAVIDIAQRWDQLLGYASLRLGADIGQDVIEVVPRAHSNDPALRTKEFCESLSHEGTLTGTIRVPDTIADLDISVDLRARQIAISTDFGAPSDKGGRGRIGWLLRQLSDAPERLVVEAFAKNARAGVAADLSSVREDPARLLSESNGDPAKFRLIARSELGTNRRAGRKPGFSQSVIAAVEAFYGDVHQQLAAYRPKAPRLQQRPPVNAPEVELPNLPSVDLRGLDDLEIGSASEPDTSSPAVGQT